MQDIRRQQDRNLKEAVYESVRGDVAKSLAKLEAQILEIRNREERLKEIARDYAKQSRSARHEVRIYTDDRKELQKSIFRFQERVSSLDFGENGKKKGLLEWEQFKDTYIGN
jgi:hypothetical protein